MGKKLLIGLMSLMMVGMLAGIGQAAVVTYENSKTLNQTLAGAGTYSYFHDMPSDFGVPTDVILDAELTISYQRALAVGFLSVFGEVVPGSPGFVASWFAKDADFNLSAVLDPWVAGTQLKIDVTGLGVITLLESKLHLEYENKTAVPEPSTLILLGSGLLGLVMVGRKKIQK